MKHTLKSTDGDPTTGEERGADPLFFALLETARALQERLEDALKAVGLSRAKMETLDQLVRAGQPVPLRALAEGQRCVPSNVTTLVDRLEGEGLVRRVNDPADRRSVRAELTPIGGERAAEGMAIVARVQEEFAASLPARERDALGRILAFLRPV